MDVKDRLFDAVRGGDLDDVRDIVNTYGLSYAKAWTDGYVLLRISTKNKHSEVTKFLLSSGARVNSAYKSKKSYDTPLHNAAANGDTEVVEMLLQKGANIRARNGFGGTALHDATYRNQMEVIQLLINKGVFVNDKNNEGGTALHTACERGLLEPVQILLKHKANVNAACTSNRKSGYTPLHYAASRGKADIVDVLIKHHAQINAKTKTGLTPIVMATRNQYESVVKILLENGANVDAQDVMGKSILCMAVEKYCPKIVQHILNHGPDLKNKYNAQALSVAICGTQESIVTSLLEYGFTTNLDHKSLHAAVEKGYIKIVEHFLNSGTNVNTFYKNSSKKSQSLLHSATKNKQFEIASMLIKYGANVNVKDQLTKTPIYYAIENSDLKTMQLLIAHRADLTICQDLLITAVKKDFKEAVVLLLQHDVDVNIPDLHGRTALHFPSISDFDPAFGLFFNDCNDAPKIEVKLEITKMLLEKGANVNAKAKNGRTPLHGACYKGYTKIVEILFEHNAEMIADDEGVLPLHLCVQNGSLEILKILLSKGADVNSQQVNGMAPLHIATHEAQIEVLEVLLNCGAEVDCKARGGVTPLHVAAQSGYVDFVETLLKYGADINCQDSQGRTAFNVASKEGSDKVLQTLLEYGCNVNLSSFKSPISGFMAFEHLLRDLPLDDDDDDDDDDDFDDDEYDDDDFYGSEFDYFGSDSDYPGGSDNDFYDLDMDFLDHGRGFMMGTQTVVILEHHRVMMKAANLPFSCGPESVFFNTQLDNYQKECELEVEKLKSQKIANYNVTFYDILSKPIHQLAIYARNEEIVKALRSDYQTKFPIYSSMINRNFVRGMDKKQLLDQGYKFFDLLSQNLSIIIPYNCVESICSYLGDKDLRVLNEVSK